MTPRPRPHPHAHASTRARRCIAPMLGAVVALGVPCTGVLRAQSAAVSGTRVSAASIAGVSGGTATAGTRMVNGTGDTVVVTPRLGLPPEWGVLLGARPFTLAPGDADSWMVSVRIPARAAAGRYVISMDADAAGAPVVHDSVVVEVASRRALSVILADQPSYAISGHAWRASFLVRNDGNVTSRVALRSSSALGTAAVVETPALTLAANESRTISVRAAASLVDQQSRDDVLELFATDAADTSVAASASARVTIVQRAGRADVRHTVASSLRVRAAERNTGVSPFELTGGGKLRASGDEQVDFTVRGSAGPLSPFGDRDQYSLAVRAPTYTAQLGDALYGTSPLLSSGQLGMGAGLEVTRGTMSYGGYANRARYQFTGGTEEAAFVSMRPSGMFGAPQFTLTGMNRAGSYLAGRILGSAVALHPLKSMLLEAELAGSDGPSGHGLAKSLHVSGGDRVGYDASHMSGGDGFAGVTRGSVHDFTTVSARVTDDIQLSASASRHESRGLFLDRVLTQGLRTSQMELGLWGQLSLRYISLSRTSQQLGVDGSVSQQSLGARVEESVGPVHLWGSGDAGRSRAIVDDLVRPYRAFTYGVSTNVGAQRLSLYGESHQGSTVTLGADRYSSVGGDASVHVGRATTIEANALRTRIPDLPLGEFGQLDVRVAQSLFNGATAAIRARFMSGASAAYYGRRLMYLEYSMPLHLPTDQVPVAGRVRGQVVNETGMGIAGALVRLGPQAGITDDRGMVTFAGVPAGQYRLSLAQQASRRETVFNGDATVQVDASRRSATPFRIAVERAATITGTVREMRVARTGIGSAPDSLADAGPLAGALVALMGARDTIYRTTNAAGVYDFTDVASGRWTVRVADDEPELTQWKPQAVDLQVTPGQTSRAEFVRVPRHREVRILNGDGEAAKVETVPSEDRRRQR